MQIMIEIPGNMEVLHILQTGKAKHSAAAKRCGYLSLLSLFGKIINLSIFPLNRILDTCFASELQADCFLLPHDL